MHTEKFTLVNLSRTEMEVMREYIRALNYCHKYHQIEVDIYSTAPNKYSIAVEGCVSTEGQRITDFMKLMFNYEEELTNAL